MGLSGPLIGFSSADDGFMSRGSSTSTTACDSSAGSSTDRVAEPLTAASLALGVDKSSQGQNWPKCANFEHPWPYKGLLE